jgi:hypothetical protein
MIFTSLFFLFYFSAPFSIENAFYLALVFLAQTVYTYVKWIYDSTGVKLQNTYYRPGNVSPLR